MAILIQGLLFAIDLTISVSTLGRVNFQLGTRFTRWYMKWKAEKENK